MLTTLHSPSETPCQPSRASSTAPSPNNNLQPQPRDSLLGLSLPSTPTAPLLHSSLDQDAGTVHAEISTVPLPPNTQEHMISTAHVGYPAAPLPSAHQPQALFAVDGGKPAADLWSWNALWVADVSLTMTLPPSSSRSNTPLWPREMRAATKKRPYSSAQATCPASRLESSGNAAQVQSSTEPHTTPAPAFSQYRRNGKN